MSIENAIEKKIKMLVLLINLEVILYSPFR